jgi:hypothetical protein
VGVVGISHNVNLIARTIKFFAIVDVATQLLNVAMPVSAAELQRKAVKIMLKNAGVHAGNLLLTVVENNVVRHLKRGVRNLLKNVTARVVYLLLIVKQENNVPLLPK